MTEMDNKPLLVLVPLRDESRDATFILALVLGLTGVLIVLHKSIVGESVDWLLDSGIGSTALILVGTVILMMSQRFRSFSAVRCEFYPDYLRYRFSPDDSPTTKSVVIPYFEIRGLKMRQGPRQARRGVADIRIGLASRKMQREACCWLGRDFFLFDVPVADHQFEKIHSIVGRYFREHPDALETRRHLEDGRKQA